MNFDQQYSEFLKASSWYAHARYGDAGEAAYLALGVAGEAGEFADEIKKIVRKTGFYTQPEFEFEVRAKKKKLLLELGDPLWYITRLCDFLGVTLDQLRVLNTLKLYERMKVAHANGMLPIPLPAWPFDDDERFTYEEARALWLDLFGMEVTGDE